MGRPPLPIGAHGKIKAKEIRPKLWEARCRVRDRDGEMLQLRRTGPSETAAIRAVQKRATELAAEILTGQLKSTTRFKLVAQAWLDELEREANLGALSHGTIRTYRSVLNNHVLPALGALQMNSDELSGTAVDGLVKRTHDKVGYSTAATTRAVVQGICAYAMRHQILSVNPAASIGRLVRGDDQEEIRALTLAERKDLIAKLGEHGWAKQKDKLGRPLGGGRGRIWLDMPDLVRAMLATGVRLGELLALDAESFSRDEHGKPIIHITAHIVRENGEVIRKPYRKRSKKYLVLEVPAWSVSMWQRRQMTAAMGEGPMFPSGRGSWMHPDVAGHRIREAFDACGYRWVKSHHFRKTVATVLAEAGLPSREIADQLGHADEATARKFYVAKVSNAAGAAVLQSINPEE